jgi:hypothetical protein
MNFGREERTPKKKRKEKKITKRNQEWKVKENLITQNHSLSDLPHENSIKIEIEKRFVDISRRQKPMIKISPKREQDKDCSHSDLK